MGILVLVDRAKMTREWRKGRAHDPLERTIARARAQLSIAAGTAYDGATARPGVRSISMAERMRLTSEP